METIKGIVTKVFCVKNDWASFVVKQGKAEYKCVGKSGDVKTGMDVEIEAKKSVHPVYGPQYEILSFKMMIPSGSEGIQAYLSSGIIKGIGPETAKKIVQMFGDKTFNIIEHQPQELLKIPRVMQKQVDALRDSLKDFKHHQELFEITKGEITLNEVEKIWKTYKENAIKVLKENPYQLCDDIDGMGFLKTDRIAKACGVEDFADCRVKAAITFVLEQVGAQMGHCFITVDQMEKETLTILNRMPSHLLKLKGFEKKAFEAYCNWEDEKEELFLRYKLNHEDIAAMESWYQQGILFSEAIANVLFHDSDEERIVLEGEYIASARLYQAEQRIANSVRKMLHAKPHIENRMCVEQFIQRYEQETGFSLAPEQKEAVIQSVTNRISIITGGPGRGKTTIIQVIAAFWKEYVNDDIILMAPTGRAAQRIKESMGNTGMKAYTIDRMTGCGRMPAMRKVYPKTLIICDECSMINVNLGKYLLDFSEQATIIMVGDADQLPPVGPGNVFKDMIASKKIPVSRLITCYRNAGLIAENADLANAGKSNLKEGEDFKLHYMGRENMLKEMVSDYMSLVNKGVSVKDICLVTLQVVRGATNATALNAAIQEAYNAQEKNLITSNPKPANGSELRVGDRVMQTKNDYHMEWSLNGTTGTGVFNGDLGIISSIDCANNQVEVTFDDGRISQYRFADTNDLALAYAMTAHKVQGSEYKYVLFSVCMDQYMLLSREVIYTVITRAKTSLHGFFEKKALALAIRNAGKNKRNTRLCEFLQNL